MSENMLIKYGDFIDYLNRRISGPVAVFLAKFNARPNIITLVRSLLVVLAMYLFYRATIWSFFYGGLFIQVADILDYVDGDLARLTKKTSKFGEWLEYLENNFQGTFGSLPGLFIAWGFYDQTSDVRIWFILFFLVFGMHMKKAFIVTPVKSDNWVFNLLDRSSFSQFSQEMNKNITLVIARTILWISTRELNLLAITLLLLPLTYARFGLISIYYALFIVAIAHNLTWMGIVFYQYRVIREK